MTTYDAVSASSHLLVGTAVWRQSVAPEHRDNVPDLVAGDDSSADPFARVEAMTRDGVDAEVLFPATLGNRSLTGLEPELQVAAVRGYNDWLSESFAGKAPERLIGVALLPATRVQDAVDEMTRVSSMPGIGAALLQQWPNGSAVPIPADDRFWEEAITLRMPLVAWRTFGGGAAAAPRPASVPEPMPTALALCSGQCATQNQLIYEGVLDRFPALQILFAGVGAGWVPNQIEQADDMFRRHRYWGGYAEHHTEANYFPRHFKWTFTRDPAAIKLREVIGVENVLWSSNYPLADNDWPESRQHLDKQLGNVPGDEARAIAADNAVKFFRLGS